jgi:hypothetical protein
VISLSAGVAFEMLVNPTAQRIDPGAQRVDALTEFGALSVDAGVEARPQGVDPFPRS